MKKFKNRERNILKRFFVNEKEDERIKLMMRKTGIEAYQKNQGPKHKARDDDFEI